MSAKGWAARAEQAHGFEGRARHTQRRQKAEHKTLLLQKNALRTRKLILGQHAGIRCAQIVLILKRNKWREGHFVLRAQAHSSFLAWWLGVPAVAARFLQLLLDGQQHSTLSFMVNITSTHVRMTTHSLNYSMIYTTVVTPGLPPPISFLHQLAPTNRRAAKGLAALPFSPPLAAGTSLET